MGRRQDEISTLLDEFSSAVFSLLRNIPYGSESYRYGRPRASPAGLVSLLLGMSMALMLSGSVTFMIGFVLMPWILGLVMVLHFVGMMSSLSAFGRSIVCPGPPSPIPHRMIPSLCWIFILIILFLFE